MPASADLRTDGNGKATFSQFCDNVIKHSRVLMTAIDNGDCANVGFGSKPATPLRVARYLTLLANPNTAFSISTGLGGHPATTASTGITFDTRPQLA